ncbi:MAG: tetratricopeptide repeat protein, partial [Flavobacteriales bacterium]
ISCLLSNRGFSEKTDSLQNLIKTTHSDTTKISALNRLGWLIMYSKPDSSITLSLRALKLAKKIENKKKIADSRSNLGVYYWLKSDYTKALESHFKSLEIRKEINHKKGIASCYNNIGNVYRNQSNYPKALKYYFNALEIYKKLNNSDGKASTYNNIGNVYYNQNNFPKTLEYYFKSLKIEKKMNNKTGIATSYNNIGIIYKFQKNYTKSLEYYFKALELRKELNNKRGIGHTYNNIGSLLTTSSNKADSTRRQIIEWFRNKGEWKKIKNKEGGKKLKDEILSLSEYYQKKSLEIHKQLGDKKRLTFALTGLGNIAIQRGQLQRSVGFYRNSFSIADTIGSLGQKKTAAKHLSNVYEQMNMRDSALQYHKIFTKLKDSIFSKEKRKELGRQESKFKWKQKLLKKEEQRKREQAVAKEEAQQQQLIIWSIAGVLSLVIIFALILLNRLKIIRKQKQEVDKAYSLLDQKNTELTDSINYAQKIQQALLQSEEHTNEQFPEHFILFKPKDVVSGDFYWGQVAQNVEDKIQNQAGRQKYSKGNPKSIYMTVSDCTGHGVPGAFMSMLGISYLNEIMKENNDLYPGDILDKIKERLVDELSQNDGSSKDGMDMVLVEFLYDANKNGECTVRFAGAKNPLYVIRKGIVEEVREENLKYIQKDKNIKINNSRLKPFKNSRDGIEIKGDKQAVGLEDGKWEPFTTVELQLRKGDMLYLFSDGYADQFGGEKDKKFRYKPFKELLVSLSDKNPEEQKQVLNQTFNEWKGKRDQIDDVCVMGIRI